MLLWNSKIIKLSMKHKYFVSPFLLLFYCFFLIKTFYSSLSLCCWKYVNVLIWDKQSYYIIFFSILPNYFLFIFHLIAVKWQFSIWTVNWIGIPDRIMKVFSSDRVSTSLQELDWWKRRGTINTLEYKSEATLELTANSGLRCLAVVQQRKLDDSLQRQKQG